MYLYEMTSEKYRPFLSRPQYMYDKLIVKVIDMDAKITINSSSPFYKHGLTLISAWISKYTHYKMWDEITYPFLNFNGATVEV